MISRRLLYLDTHQLTAWQWQHGQLIEEDAFTPRNDDLSRFSAYLAAHRPSQYSLLANVAEEGHVVENIPYLRGNDRQDLIRRKLGQHFPGTPLTTAISLGYEKTKRKNEKLLLSALTKPEHFTPWLSRIGEAEVPLAGIYSLAQLGGLLLGKLGHRHQRCLLLTLQDHSIRESYLVNGEALFSRMTPLTDSSIAGIASRFAAESGKLHEYLLGQRLIGRDERLPVFIVAHPQAIPAIRSACQENDNGNLPYEILDNHQCAHQLALHTPPEDSRSERLFLHLLASSPPRQQFADAERRHDYRLAQIRQALLGLGAVCLLGSGLFVAKEMYQIHLLEEETAALNSKEAELDWRYREISATFPQLGIDNETLRRITNRYAELVHQQIHPGPAFQAIAQAFDQTPAAELETLDWKQENSEEIITLRGSMKNDPNASSRQLLHTFDQFVAILEVDRRHRVKVLQRPLEIESGRSLKGGNREDERRQAPNFSIQISRRATP